ncbi:MAG: hypothetical protein LC772_03490 [Chloroflexi bacterium]|nr:hypothetical protein [Chloroflexota bacterium]
MSKQVSPAVVAAIIVVVLVLIGLAVWKYSSSGYSAQTETASNQQMQNQFKQTGRMPGTMKPPTR